VDESPLSARCPVLLIYCGAMAFALIYLAEHYVVDLAAGMLCATVCHLALKKLLPAPEKAPAAL